MSSNSASRNGRNGSQNNVHKLKNLDIKIQNLLREAIEARNNAYCPYSNFKVGSCVMTEEGILYKGCNIENKSFPVSLCAERCAYGKAVSEGKMKFKAVAVVAYQETFFTTPCGMCRQFMSEFGNVDIYIMKPNHDDVLVTTLDELLPHQFKTIGAEFC